MHCTTLGVDVNKNVFQLHGIAERGQVVVQKRVSRSKSLATVAQLPPCLIGIEACGSARNVTYPRRKAYRPSNPSSKECAKLRGAQALFGCGMTLSVITNASWTGKRNDHS